MRSALALGLVLAACGGGSSKPKDTTPEQTAPREEAGTPEPTGALECDALIARTLCTFSKSGDAVRPEDKQAFTDGIAGWRDALANPDSRQAVVDACMISLDAGYPGYSAIGCWMVGDDYDAYQPAPPEEEPPPEELDFTFASTGNAVCDELVAKTVCMYEKTPGIPREALEAFRDGAAMWTEYLKNEATRQATIDACQMSLDGGQAGFEASGC